MCVRYEPPVFGYEAKKYIKSSRKFLIYTPKVRHFWGVYFYG